MASGHDMNGVVRDHVHQILFSSNKGEKGVNAEGINTERLSPQGTSAYTRTRYKTSRANMPVGQPQTTADTCGTIALANRLDEETR